MKKLEKGEREEERGKGRGERRWGRKTLWVGKGREDKGTGNRLKDEREGGRQDSQERVRVRMGRREE